MRALVLCPQISTEGELNLINALWATHDVRVAVDGGANHVLACGLVPDVVIGDMDSIQTSTLDELRANSVPIVCANPNKDVSDLDLALEWRRCRGVTAVSILGALGGRTDHFLAVCGSLERNADMYPRLESENEEVVIVKGSVHLTDDTAKPARLSIDRPNATFSVFGLNQDIIVSIAGAKWCLDAVRLPPLSSHGLSNQVADTCADIALWQGTAVVVINKQ